MKSLIDIQIFDQFVIDLQQLLDRRSGAFPWWSMWSFVAFAYLTSDDDQQESDQMMMIILSDDDGDLIRLEMWKTLLESVSFEYSSRTRRVFA